MDEADRNDNIGNLTPDQRELLSQLAAKRAARMAVAAGQPTNQAELTARLREMDEEFAGNPDRSERLLQENHELKRYVVILEETVRQLTTGQLAPSDTAQPKARGSKR